MEHCSSPNIVKISRRIFDISTEVPAALRPEHQPPPGGAVELEDPAAGALPPAEHRHRPGPVARLALLLHQRFCQPDR